MPYQLHCCPVLAQLLEELDELDEGKLLDTTDEATLLDERLLDVTVLDDDERIDDEATEDGAEDATEDGADDETTLDFTEDADETEDAEEAAPPQIAPVTTGVSTAPLVFTCIPNDTICPG